MKTTKELNQIADKIVELSKKVESEVKLHFLEIGKNLSEAKSICYRTKIQWNKWISENTEISLRHSDRLVELYKHSLSNPDLKLLSYSDALSFISRVDQTQVQSDNVGHRQYRNINAEVEAKEVTISQNKLDELNSEIEGLKGDNQVLKREAEESEQVQDSSGSGSGHNEENIINQVIEQLEKGTCEVCKNVLTTLKNITKF